MSIIARSTANRCPPLGHDKLAGTALICAQTTAKRGDEGLDGRREVVRQALSPQELGETVDGHRPSSCRKQDLEDLLRPASPEVTVGRVYGRRAPTAIDPNSRISTGSAEQLGAHVSLPWSGGLSPASGQHARKGDIRADRAGIGQTP